MSLEDTDNAGEKSSNFFGARNDGSLQKGENDGKILGISKNLEVFCLCFSETEYGFIKWNLL